MRTREQAIKDAQAWSNRVALRSYVYKMSNGYGVAYDLVIANQKSATVETIRPQDEIISRAVNCCAVEGCYNQRYGNREHCRKHYKEWKKYDEFYAPK